MMHGKLTVRNEVISIGGKIVLKLTLKQRKDLRAHFHATMQANRNNKLELERSQNRNRCEALEHDLETFTQTIIRLKREMRTLTKKLDFRKRISERKTLEVRIIADQTAKIIRDSARVQASLNVDYRDERRRRFQNSMNPCDSASATYSESDNNNDDVFGGKE